MADYIQLSIDRQQIISSDAFFTKIRLPSGLRGIDGAVLTIENGNIFENLIDPEKLSIALSKEGRTVLRLGRTFCEGRWVDGGELTIRNLSLKKMYDDILTFYVPEESIIGYFYDKRSRGTYCSLQAWDCTKVNLNADLIEKCGTMYKVEIPKDAYFYATEYERDREGNWESYDARISSKRLADFYGRYHGMIEMKIPGAQVLPSEQLEKARVLVPEGHSFAGSMFEIDKDRISFAENEACLSIPVNQPILLKNGESTLHVLSNDLIEAFDCGIEADAEMEL